MTGAGLVMPPADAAEVERRASAYRTELNTKGQLQADLAHRAAVLSVRLDRCVFQESEAIANRVRNAEDDFDDARHAEADRLMDGLNADPSGNLRRLRRMPEGVDRLIIAWTELRKDLAGFNDYRLDEARQLRADSLSGRPSGEFGISRFGALLKAIRGRTMYLEPGEMDDVPPAEIDRWCHRKIREYLDAKIAELVEHRKTLDLARIAADRAGSPKLALFDPSREAALARKYEAAAERGFHRALRDLKALQKPEPPAKTSPIMASFSRPDFVAELPPPKPSREASELPSNSVSVTIGRPPGRPGRR